MRGNTKTVFKHFDYMHCDDFAKYLEEMAAKGWHFKEWGFGLKFEKAEPEQAVYAVEVFTDAGEYDMRPEPSTTGVFAEYCEAAGWKMIDSKMKFVIFKKIREDAVPILTAEERLDNVCKEMRFPVFGNIILSATMLFSCWQNMFGDAGFEYRIFSESSIYVLLCWGGFFLFYLYQGFSFLYFFCWKYKNKKKLKNMQDVYIGTAKGKKSGSADWSRWMVIMLCLGMLWMMGEVRAVLFMIGFMAILLLFGFVINKMRPESEINFLLHTTFGMTAFVGVFIYAMLTTWLEDESSVPVTAPLVLEDYREITTERKEVTLYEERNHLGSREQYVILYEDDAFIYCIYRTEEDWILDKIWEDKMEAKVNEIMTDCTKEWSAELALRNETGSHYVRYEDVLLILNEEADIILTQEQIEMIRNKLDLE